MAIKVPLSDRPPEINSRKPDPTEPWRYVCPDCLKQVSGSERSWKFRCPSCGSHFYGHELYDQKEGRIVPGNDLKP